MEIKQQLTITGIKKFKGEVEGKAFDSFKVFVQEKLDDSKGNALGFATVEYSVGASEEFDRWKHLSFPVLADATLEIVVSGGNSKIIVRNIVPVKRAG